MKRTVLTILIVVFLMGQLIQALPANAQTIMVCGEAVQPQTIYLPLIGKDMANINVIESLENIMGEQPETALDAVITAIFPESVSVTIVGSDEVRSNVKVPGYIDTEKLSVGQAVRLAIHQGQYIVAAVLDKFDTENNYSGKGYPIPKPPALTVLATAKGWLVTWKAVSGAKQYRVYINDTADAISPTEVGLTNKTSMIVGYDGFPPTDKYVAVSSIGATAESNVSAWVTDSDAPPIPDTFAPGNYINAHKLTISGEDQSLKDPSFKCWEIEIADNDSGLNSESLGFFTLASFPNLQSWGEGTTKYYRIRSVDWVDNKSNWTTWDDAWSMAGTIKELFDNYGGPDIQNLETLYWWGIARCEPTENWTIVNGILQFTNPLSEGEKSIRYGIGILGSPTTLRLNKNMDLTVGGVFDNDDYIVFQIKEVDTAPGDIYITFFNSGYASGYRKALDTGAITSPLSIKRSEFISFGSSPDWSSIVAFGFSGNPDGYDASGYDIDDIRIVKADPSNPSTYNDTGGFWNATANTGSDYGEWHVYQGNVTGETIKSYSYGQVKRVDVPTKYFLSYVSGADIISGTVQSGIYMKNILGVDEVAGIAFFIHDTTPDNWNMYAVEADSLNDTVTLVKWVNGARTVLGTATFSFALEQLIWLGADFRDYDADGGRIRVYASNNEGNLIQASNMVISAQDTQWAGDAGGSVGLLSKQANVRFVNFSAGSPAHAEMADFARLADRAKLADTADHATTATTVTTATNLETKLRAPDGSPNPALSIDNDGNVDIQGKQALRGNDTWFRFNPANEYTSGSFTPGLVRADGGFHKYVSSAAYENAGWYKIATLAASGGSITFSNIPAGFKHLLVIGENVRTNYAGTGDGGTFRVNGLSTNIYMYRFLNFSFPGSSVSYTGVDNTNVGRAWRMAGATADANIAFTSEVMFYNYTQSRWKQFLSLAAAEFQADAINNMIYNIGQIKTTAAISSIAIWPWNGTAFSEGGFTMYGIL